MQCSCDSLWEQLAASAFIEQGGSVYIEVAKGSDVAKEVLKAWDRIRTEPDVQHPLERS